MIQFKQQARGGAFLRNAMPLVALLSLSSLAACEDDVAPTPKPDVIDIAQGTDASTGTTDAEQPGTDAVVATDVAAGTDAVTQDIKPPCQSDNGCKDFLVKACEMAVCNLGTGQCEAKPKPGTCCTDAQCDDNNTCTLDKCDVTSAKCENGPIANCCVDQQIVLDVGFEQKVLEGFTSVDSGKNGNVDWRVETKRARTGKYSVYLGNECSTYDTSISAATACQGGGTGQPINARLRSPSINLPAGKNSILHFWLWLDTEPPYSLKSPGNCAKPCGAAQSCVNVGQDGSVCVNESDLLRLRINDQLLDWNSLTIGKTTEGNWRHVAVNLAAWTGKGVQVSWEFATANGQQNGYEGVYLDDIRVETLCADDNTLCDAGELCSDDGNPCSNETCNVFVNGQTGLCFYDKIPSCCTSAVDCSDKNDCTVDVCNKAPADATGSCKNPPNTENAQCCLPTKLYSDPLDTASVTKDGAGGSWKVVSSNSQTVGWQINATGGATGTGLTFSDATFAKYDDQSIKPQGPRGVVCSKQVTLSAGTLYNVATFQLKLSTEWDGQPKDQYVNPPDIEGAAKADVFSVYVESAGQLCGPTECKAPGVTLPEGLWTSDKIQGSTDGKWLPVSINLDKWAGKPVRLCFGFDAGDSFANSAGFATVDDVSIEVVCSEGACNFDAQCADACGSCQAGLCVGGSCVCEAVAGCCTKAADCDDGDTCTTETCGADGQCTYNQISPTCCSNKTPLSTNFEGDGKLPSGWKTAFLTGQPQESSKAYSKLVNWTVTPTKAFGGSTYSMYFGTNGVTYNAGNEVPAAVVRSTDLQIPGNGTTLVTFNLYLSTEWNPPANNPNYKFSLDKALWDTITVDRLRVGFYDPTIIDQKKATTWAWTSYSIEGTTNGKWASVVFAVPEAVKGKKMRLAVEFDAGSTTLNNYEGAFIDNLELSTVCEAPACISDEQCIPASPDVCKKYYCAKDPNAALFSCQEDVKAGPTCCVSTVAVPQETFEGGDIKLTSYVADGNSNIAKWQVVPKKYGNGQFELYFGNPAATNYADAVIPGTAGAKGTVTLTKSAPLSADVKKNAFLNLKAWFDIEKQFEKFEIRVTVLEAGIKDELVWTNLDKTYFNPDTQLKTPLNLQINLAKYKGLGNLQFTISFDSIDKNKNDQFGGIWLDDISITEPCQ